MKNHALKFNTEIRMLDDSKVELRDDKKIVITKKGGETNEIEAGAIIVATGAHFKRLGCEGETEHIGQGVSFCAVCDGAFFEPWMWLSLAAETRQLKRVVISQNLHRRFTSFTDEMNSEQTEQQ